MKFRKATAEPKGFARQTAWMATAKGIAFMLALAMPLVLVRQLDQAEFGLYKQAFQILMTLLSLLCLQVSASAYYFMPREPQRKPQVALNVMVFYLAVGGAVALLFAVYPRWVTLIFNGDGLVPVVPLLGVTIMLWLIALNFESVMIANGDIRWSSAMTVCVQVLRTSMLIGAALVAGSVRALVAGALIVGAVHCAVYVFYMRRRFGQFWRTFDWPLFKAQLGNSLPFGIGSIAYIVQFDLHNYYVSHYFPPAEFAIYAIGCFQLPLLQVLIDASETILLPEIARLEKDNAQGRILDVWAGAMRLLAFVFFPVCALLLVVRREFIVTMFTATYESATPIFAVNLFNLLLYICLAGTLLRAFPEFKYFRIKFCLILLPVTFGALHLGLGAGGLVGAITAVALTRLFDVGVTMAVIGRRLGLTWRDLHHFAPLARLGAATLVAALVTYTVKFALASRPAPVILAVGAAVFGLVYLGAVYAVGAITAEEQARLRGLWARFYRSGAVRFGLSSATSVAVKEQS